MALQQMLLAGGAGGMTLMGAIGAAGLTSNLVLCLDSGDAASYTSGQSWLDRSGNGYDFFLGAGGTVTSTDPTFNGTAGHLDAYWSFDGTQYFTYDTTNETWMQNIHKDNAAYTLLAVVKTPSFGATSGVAGTDGGAGGTGFHYFVTAALGEPSIQIRNAGVLVCNATAATALSTTAYNVIALSVNEATGAGGGFHWLNGAYNQTAGADTFDSTYSSPAAGNATTTMQIAAAGSAALVIVNGANQACFAAWSTALTKAQLDTLYALLRGRFGL